MPGSIRLGCGYGAVLSSMSTAMTFETKTYDVTGEGFLEKYTIIEYQTTTGKGERGGVPLMLWFAAAVHSTTRYTDSSREVADQYG